MSINSLDVSNYLKKIYDQDAKIIVDAKNADKELPENCFISLDNVIKALNAATSEEIETVTQCTSSFIASINVTADINDVPFLKINTDIDDKEMQRAYLFEETKGSVKKGCFIATAVYGSPYSPEVRFLRRYRDDILSKSIFGKYFIKKYYTYSPNIANRLKPLSFIKILLKMIINTFIKIKKFKRFNDA